MKKLIPFFSFAVLVAAMCVMSGCKDDDKDDDKGGSSEAKALVGRWLQMQSRGADKTEWTDWNLEVSGAIQFDKNGMFGTYLAGVIFPGTEGTYKVDGKKITITFADNSTQTYEIREMSKDKNYMEILLYKSDGTPDVYYRYSRCPKDADEAKKMLLAQWKYEAPEGYYDHKPYNETYVDLSKEGKEYDVLHYKKDLSSDSWDYPYRGMYICWGDDIFDVKFTPDRTDPTKGTYSGVNCMDNTWSGTINVSRLCYQSMICDGSRYFIRVEKPITYKLIEETP